MISTGRCLGVMCLPNQHMPDSGFRRRAVGRGHSPPEARNDDPATRPSSAADASADPVGYESFRVRSPAPSGLQVRLLAPRYRDFSSGNGWRAGCCDERQQAGDAAAVAIRSRSKAANGEAVMMADSFLRGLLAARFPRPVISGFWRLYVQLTSPRGFSKVDARRSAVD